MPSRPARQHRSAASQSRAPEEALCSDSCRARAPSRVPFDISIVRSSVMAARWWLTLGDTKAGRWMSERFRRAAHATPGRPGRRESVGRCSPLVSRLAHREVVPAEAQDQRHLGVGENELARLVADGIDQLRQGALRPGMVNPRLGEEDTEGYRFLHHRGGVARLEARPEVAPAAAGQSARYGRRSAAPGASVSAGSITNVGLARTVREKRCVRSSSRHAIPARRSAFSPRHCASRSARHYNERRAPHETMGLREELPQVRGPAPSRKSIGSRQRRRGKVHPAEHATIYRIDCSPSQNAASRRVLASAGLAPAPGPGSRDLAVEVAPERHPVSISF
jgi:hypothetical protein